jgi:hypothetical protein
MVAVGSASAGALSAGLLATATGSLPAVFWASAAVIAVPALLTARSLRAADHPLTASNRHLPPTITETNP